MRRKNYTIPHTIGSRDGKPQTQLDMYFRPKEEKAKPVHLSLKQVNEILDAAEKANKTKSVFANHPIPMPKIKQTQQYQAESEDDYSEYTEASAACSQEDKCSELTQVPPNMFILPDDAINAFENVTMVDDVKVWKYNKAFHVPGQIVHAFDFGHYLKDMYTAYESLKSIAEKDFCDGFEKAYKNVWDILAKWFTDHQLTIDKALSTDYCSAPSSQEK